MAAALGSDSDSEGELVWQRAAASHAPATVSDTSGGGDPCAGPSGSGSKRWHAGAGPPGEPPVGPGPSGAQRAGAESLQAAPAQPVRDAGGRAGTAPLSVQPCQAEAPGEWCAGGADAGMDRSGNSRRLSVPQPVPAKPPPALAPRPAESLPAAPAPAAKLHPLRGSVPEPSQQPPAALESTRQGAPGAGDAQLGGGPKEAGKQQSPTRSRQLRPVGTPVLSAPAGSPVLQALGELAAQQGADRDAGEASGGKQPAPRTPAFDNELDCSSVERCETVPAGVKEELDVQQEACHPETGPALAPHDAPAQLPADGLQPGGAAPDAQPSSSAAGALRAAGLQEVAAERAEITADAKLVPNGSAERRGAQPVDAAAVQHCGEAGIAAQEAAPPAVSPLGPHIVAGPAPAPAAAHARRPPPQVPAHAPVPAAAPQQRPSLAVSEDEQLLAIIKDEQRMADEAAADAAERLEAEAAAALDEPAAPSGVWQQGLDVDAELATLDVETRVRAPFACLRRMVSKQGVMLRVAV